MKKRCSKCRKLQDVKNFSKNATKNDGRDHYCKKCNRKRMHAFFKTAAGKAAMKRAALKRKKSRR